MPAEDDIDYGLLTVEDDGSYSPDNFPLTEARIKVKQVSVFLEVECYFKYQLEGEEDVDAVFKYPWRNADHTIYWCEITEKTDGDDSSSSTMGKIVEKFEAQASEKKVEHKKDYQIFYRAKASKYDECEFRIMYVTTMKHVSGEKKLEYILPELMRNQTDDIPIEFKFSVDTDYGRYLTYEGKCFTPGTHKLNQKSTALEIQLKYINTLPCSLHYSKGRPLGGYLEQDVAVLTMPRPDSEEENACRDLSQGEYIFCVDRSGSMGGERIMHARETLLLFLKSLPVGCSFNIYSFGSRSEALFASGSQEYNEKTLNLASDLQQRMTNNMGGTNLLPSLEEIYSREPLDGKFRAVFVITDGGIFDTDRAIAIVKKNVENTTVCAFGVGSGADRGLVEGLAEAGGGQHDFVNTEDRSMETKVISALQWATMGGGKRAVRHTLPAGMEIDRTITTNTDERIEVHFAVLKGKPKGKGKKPKQASFTFKMNGDEQQLDAEIPVDSPGEDDHLPLHMAAAGESLLQNISLSGLGKTALCEKVNIFLPDLAVRSENYVVRASDINLTELIGVSVPEEIPVIVPAAPSPSPWTAPAPSTSRIFKTAKKLGTKRGGFSFGGGNAARSINKPTLTRIARRAGVGRFSGLVYEEARQCLVHFMRKIIKDSILYAENGKRKTVTEQDVDCSLKKNGVKMFGVEDYAPYIFESEDKKPKRRGARPTKRTWARTTPVGNPNATTSIATILGVDHTTAASKGTLKKPSRSPISDSDGDGDATTAGNVTPTTAKRTRLSKKPTIILDSDQSAGSSSTSEAATTRKRKSTSVTSTTKSVSRAASAASNSGEPAAKRGKAAAAAKTPARGKGAGVKKGKQPLRKGTRSTRTASAAPVTAGGGFVKNFTIMIQLISLQNFDGSWDLSVELAKILKYTKDQLIGTIPDIGSDTVSMNQWGTILAFTWLNTYYSEQQTEWEMIGYKAREYTNKGFASAKSNTLDTLKLKAKSLFPDP